MMPGQRCMIQSSSWRPDLLGLGLRAGELLNPQLMQTMASGGSSSLAQCGQRGTSSSSLITSIFAGPSSSSSMKRVLSGAGVAAGAAPPGEARAFGSETTNACSQCLHLIFFPNTDGGILQDLRTVRTFHVDGGRHRILAVSSCSVHAEIIESSDRPYGRFADPGMGTLNSPGDRIVS